MKTSPNNTRAIEQYLTGSLNPVGALLFQVRLLTDPGLRANLAEQKQVYALVQRFGRQQLRSRLEMIHRDLFQDPKHKSFQQEVYRNFTKP
jgi:hypothetical protein